VTSTEPLVGPGSILGGRYEIVRRIARGGMGIVWEARHTALGRRVAIKVLKAELVGSEPALERFRREAKAAAVIRHPHIVDVVDYGVTDRGEPYIVMELLDGEDLATLLAREGRLPVGRACGIARQVARGLSVAHTAGIVHRDLKAENVFLLSIDGCDFAKILDFGIARSAESDGEVSRLTGTGMVMGTPHYLSPEAARGQTDLDRRADLYALGVIVYEMIVGHPPFRGGSLLEVVYKHIHEAPISPRTVHPDVPTEIDAVVLRALEKDREVRWQSAEEMLAALPGPAALPGGDRAGPLIGISTGSAPPSRSTPSPLPRTRTTAAITQSPQRRTPAGPIAIAALGLVLAAGAATALLLADEPGPARAVPEPLRDPFAEPSGPENLSASPPAVPAEVTFRIRSTPVGARVFVDGRDVGVTPMVVKAPRGEGACQIVIEGAGAREERTLSKLLDADIEVALQPSRPGAPRTSSPAGKTQGGGEPPDRKGDLRPNPYGR